VCPPTYPETFTTSHQNTRQAEDCLRLEEERVDNYLHTSTRARLLREVETQLLGKYEAQLLAKEHSGCAALLRDDKARIIAADAAAAAVGCCMCFSAVAVGCALLPVQTAAGAHLPACLFAGTHVRLQTSQACDPL
jgi:hypothetical protein